MSAGPSLGSTGPQVQERWECLTRPLRGRDRCPVSLLLLPQVRVHLRYQVTRKDRLVLQMRLGQLLCESPFERPSPGPQHSQSRRGGGRGLGVPESQKPGHPAVR